MDKEKKEDHVHEHPVKMGDKYVCPHCQAELPVKRDCPVCKMKLDWSKV